MTSPMIQREKSKGHKTIPVFFILLLQRQTGMSADRFRTSNPLSSFLRIQLRTCLIQPTEHKPEHGPAFFPAGGIKTSVLSGTGTIFPTPEKFGNAQGNKVVADRVMQKFWSAAITSTCRHTPGPQKNIFQAPGLAAKISDLIQGMDLLH